MAVEGGEVVNTQDGGAKGMRNSGFLRPPSGICDGGRTSDQPGCSRMRKAQAERQGRALSFCKVAGIWIVRRPLA
jgi:hypothetical protein